MGGSWSTFPEENYVIFFKDVNYENKPHTEKFRKGDPEETPPPSPASLSYYSRSEMKCGNLMS